MNSDSRFSSDEVTFNLTKEDNETLKGILNIFNNLNNSRIRRVS